MLALILFQTSHSSDLDISDDEELQQAFDLHSLIISSLNQEPMFTAEQIISELEGMLDVNIIYYFQPCRVNFFILNGTALYKLNFVYFTWLHFMMSKCRSAVINNIEIILVIVAAVICESILHWLPYPVQVKLHVLRAVALSLIGWYHSIISVIATPSSLLYHWSAMSSVHSSRSSHCAHNMNLLFREMRFQVS